MKRKIEVESLPQIFSGVKKDLESRQSSPKYPTGLKELDRIIWGLHKKELLTIGARPSEGKSSLAGQLAFNLADINNNVLFISLEMSRQQMVERMFCNVTKTNNLTLREGKMDDEIKKRLNIFDKLIEDLPLIVVDNCGYDFSDVEKIIKEMEPKPDIVFLDYIQLVSQKGYSSKSMAVEEYFRKMKELSVEYDFAMVVISQIKRMDEKRQNRRPTMDELKWSGAIEEHSDAIILLYWIIHSEFGYGDPNEYEMNVAKQRHGPIGLTKFNFYPQYYRFEDREEVVPNE